MSILFDNPKEKKPARLNQIITFDVPLNLVIIGTLISSVFFLGLWGLLG